MDRNKEFWESKRKARMFGVSNTRVQEHNIAFLRKQRFKNLQLRSWEVPPFYSAEIDAWITKWECVKLQTIDTSLGKSPVLYVDDEWGMDRLLREIIDKPVLALDFEFHLDNSYDGKINYLTGASVLPCIAKREPYI
jgi:hypothetical protein